MYKYFLTVSLFFLLMFSGCASNDQANDSEDTSQGTRENYDSSNTSGNSDNDSGGGSGNLDNTSGNDSDNSSENDSESTSGNSSGNNSESESGQIVDRICRDGSVQTACPKKGDTIAIMVTDFGTVKIKLFPEKVSETVKNFETLASQGFYNNLNFHRVIKDFMIQGGDPKGDGTGGYSYKGPGTTIAEEFDPELTHIYGALSMAKTAAPNTTGSQFFIVQNQAGTHWLNNAHSVFGQVFEGMNTIEAIAAQPVSAADKPLRSITIRSIVVTKYTEEEANEASSS